MQALVDVFGFLTVLVCGLDLIARTVLVGSVAFVLAGIPSTALQDLADSGVLRSVSRSMVVAAFCTIVTASVAAILNVSVLVALDVPLADALRARFVAAAAITASAAALIAVAATARNVSSTVVRIGLALLGVTILVAALADSHAAARLSDARVLLAATLFHQLGAALWLGGLACFGTALRGARTPAVAAALGRRYSTLSIAGVAMIVAGVAVFAVDYIGSPQGAYGTAYGEMAVAKTLFLVVLLLLGLHNFRTVRMMTRDPRATPRVARMVGVEMGIGIAVLMTAASMTATAPAVDIGEDRVTLEELLARWKPASPRFSSPEHDTLAMSALQAKLDAQTHSEHPTAAYAPGADAAPPRTAADIAWSEYNHHWSGLFVLLIGIAALAARSGRAALARHWPLLFAAVALLILLRGDPEVWPLGSLGLVESLQDPEVVQHRLFALLLIGFAVFEWRVQTGRARALNARRVFPLLVAAAGTLLVTHSHALGNVREEVLVESTHLPIAFFGVLAGWARWLEVESPATPDGRIGGWVWPACFCAIGILLLNYREA